MAGYRRKPKIYTLKWAEDHELHGLMVSVKGLSVAKLLDLTEKAAVLAEVKDTGEGSDGAKDIFHGFADSLVQWNLEDENGAAVPATYDGIAGQDIEFVLEIVTSWMEAVASVGSPLPAASPNGNSALEASLPVATLSGNPSS